MEIIEGVLRAKERIGDDLYCVTIFREGTGESSYEVPKTASHVTTLASSGCILAEEASHAFKQRVGAGAKLVVDDYGHVVLFRVEGQPGYAKIIEVAKDRIRSVSETSANRIGIRDVVANAWNSYTVN